MFWPLLGIDDPRTSQRINFVGGIHGAAELEGGSRAAACAFDVSTRIEDLMAIAMPASCPSTWFEPKLRDAMFAT